NQSKGFEKDKASNSKFGQVSLFVAKWMNDKWSEAQPVSFASVEYSMSNPSLSKDGRTLYFSSNMPGGQGGVDIWKVAVNADGSFGTPENLGAKVNTAADESFPFIADDGSTLYFASKGHAGFGGYDIFMIDLKGKNEVVNLGVPVNGAQDDFAFSYYPAKEVGFMSSNRSGVDNIYKLIPVCGVPIYVLVTDAKTQQPLAGAKVSILDEKKNVIATEMSNAKGEASFYGECKKGYTIAATMPQYEGNAFPVEASNGQERRINAALNP
ncbi:carboxypeptidase regulatory-like domain-containing protein, partial [Arthrospira platensis SPKY1]|nr:carboxypeptidase regulatory-like domain-containing protein [Arthrospira platensis SPKY1]